MRTTAIAPDNRILALDIGSKTGYVCFRGLKYIESGRLLLPSPLPDQYRKLKELVVRLAPDVLAYEMTDWHRPGDITEEYGPRLQREKINRMVQRGLGRKEAFCEAIGVELGILVRPVTVHKAKKSMTGKGNASKDTVEGFVREVFGPIMGSRASTDEIDAFSVIAPLLEEIDVMWRLKIRKENEDQEL